MWLKFKVGSLQPCFSVETQKHLNKSSRILLTVEGVNRWIEGWERNKHILSLTGRRSHHRKRTHSKAQIRGIIYDLFISGEDEFYLWKVIYPPAKKPHCFSSLESQTTTFFFVPLLTALRIFTWHILHAQMEQNAPNRIITQILPSGGGLGETTKQHTIKYSAHFLVSLCQQLSSASEGTQSVKLVCFP